ncbi:MAG: VWA domain-containing protein [Humibacillus sp.]|nr:VWA domain-containing protein [Humibacillus sp.]MDN5777190.1 VWA domain-containing protein [Humibacillus sp.]
MTFALPSVLFGLTFVPLLLGVYAWKQRRRRRTTVRYSNVDLVRAAVGPVRRWRRHVPIGLVLASLTLLGLASARPQVRADVPVSSATIILALDVSGSMCATDVDPNRLAAAQAAVRTFVRGQDQQTKVGLVLFSGSAQLAVAPTTNHDDLLAAIAGATTGRGTTIGSAILTSIDAIAELDPDVAPSDTVDQPDDGLATPPGAVPNPPLNGKAGPGSSGQSSLGNLAPEIIVLLTDGANTRGVTPAEAAVQAAARGIRVYPIGFGTKNPTQLVCSRDQIGASSGRQFSGDVGNRFVDPSGRNYLVVDEAALKNVATTTKAEYFAATDAGQLDDVLQDLPKHVTVQQQDVDISVWFALAAAVVLVGGLVLSIRWSTLT